VGADITIDDVPNRPEGELKVGMIVNVKGSRDDVAKLGTALKIEARDALEGKIESIDPANNTITVMGQTVQIEDNLTRLNDDDAVKVFSAAGFALNDTVEVHGFADDTGALRATRVAKKATGEFESKGFVVGLGASSFGLSLTPGGASAVTVNFSAGQLPAGTANGSLVQVKAAAAPAAGVITATLIHPEDRLLGAATGEKVEVEGIVSSGALTGFVVNGQQVVTDANTVFEGGLKADFATGVKVEAQGPLNASGAIVATKITFRSNIKIEAVASGVTASGLTILGKQVAINKFTRLDAGIVDGNQVEVRATLDRNGNLIATRVVKRSNVDGKAFLQGPVTAFDAAAGTMTILGVPITTTGTAFRTSTDSTELPSTKDVFFAKVKANVTVVKVRWDAFTATTAPVKEIEIELGK